MGFNSISWPIGCFPKETGTPQGWRNLGALEIPHKKSLVILVGLSFFFPQLLSFPKKYVTLCDPHHDMSRCKFGYTFESSCFIIHTECSMILLFESSCFIIHTECSIMILFESLGFIIHTEWSIMILLESLGFIIIHTECSMIILVESSCHHISSSILNAA